MAFTFLTEPHPPSRRWDSVLRRRYFQFIVAVVAAIAIAAYVLPKGTAAAAGGLTYEDVTWNPESVQIIDTGTDCSVTMSGSILTPNARSADAHLANLRAQEPVSVGKGGIDRFIIGYEGKLTRDSSEVLVSGAAIMDDCAVVRASQPAALAAASGGQSTWKRQTLGAFVGIATYFAVATVLAGAFAAAGVEIGASVIGLSALIGCVAGAVGTGVGLTVAGESDRLGFLTVAGGCVTGAGGAVKGAVTKLGEFVGTAVRQVAFSGYAEVGGIELAEVTAEQGVTWDKMIEVVNDVANTLVAAQ